MHRVARILSCVAVSSLMATSPARCADHLALAPGLSFSDDSSDSFPIRGEHLDDAKSQAGQPTVIFFGAAHCWNTNREAERLVELYPKYQDRVSFIIVDVTARVPPSERCLRPTTGVRFPRSSSVRRKERCCTRRRAKRRRPGVTRGRSIR